MFSAPLSVTHLGPYPPTYGGVSVHIRRLHLRLLQMGHTSSVISPPGYAAFPEKCVSVARCFRHRTHWLFYPGVEIAGKIVHCHESWMFMSWVLCRLLLQGKALVITVHDQQDARRWCTTGGDRRLGARLLVRLPAVRWIAVSKTIREQLLVRGVPSRQIEVIPAFIAPAPEDSNSGVLPPALLAFLAARQPVISIYGSKYDFVDGIDLYGFDLAIEAIAALKTGFPRVGLVVSVPGKSHLDYQAELVRRATQLGCLQNILFLNEGVMDGSEMWRRSHVHLRPTLTDGDSVAVREALALGVPVVASDAAPRPPGCIQFPSRNVQALVRVLSTALASPATAAAAVGTDSASAVPAILREYRKALGEGCEGLVP